MTALIAGSHKRPRVLVIGPGRTQVGGVATFVEIVRSSTYLKERYELIHMDTTRGPRGAGVASRFTLINILYFVRQSIVFLLIGFRSRPQIMHVLVTSFWAFWKNAAFILMARLLHMKVVAHLQGGVFDHYYRESSPLAQRLIGWVMRRSDVVVALSNRWRRFLVEEVRSDLNVEVVPNTVDAMFAQAIGKDNGHKGRDPNVVLFVGGLGHRKGIYDILKAVPLVVARQPHVRFLFAGKEEQRGEQAEIDRACAEANLNGTVQFLGEVTGQAKLDLFLNASVFILPSYGENLPFALLEAMCAGLPVITTPVGAIPELVEEGQNGFLIQPGDYHALADRIVRLLENASLRTAMAHANVERVRTGYLPDMAISRFDGIYGRLLSARRQ